MAYIYNDVVGSNLPGTLYNGLSQWTNWDHVELDQLHALTRDLYWDIYYVDNTVQTNPNTGDVYVGKVGIAVPAHEPAVMDLDNTCYVITRNEDGTLNFNEHIVMTPTQNLVMIATNTVFYVGVRDNPTADPHGVFATVVMNQGNKELSEIAVGFYNNTTCVLYDKDQTSGVTEQVAPRFNNFRYTVLIPMTGLNFGVASGIYFFLYSQNPASYVPFGTMTLNEKTFYVDDNIAIIDYFTGL